VCRALLSLPDGRRPAEVVLANRTVSRAEAVAGDLADDLAGMVGPGGAAGTVLRTAGTADLPAALAGADVVVTAVETESHFIGSAELAPGGDRAERPVLVIDLGVPRNVDPAAADAAGVTVLDLDHLASVVTRAVEDRRAETEDARRIVADEVDRHRAAARARGAAPVVAALRDRLEEMRQAELDRRRSQFGELSEADWAQVDAVTRAVLAKLVHEPTTVLKETAGTARGERLVESLRTLFDL
jgi:glutamyl-tRNA reductase